MIAQALLFIKSFEKLKFLNLFDYFCQVILCQMNRLGNTIREKRKSKNLLLRHLSAMLDIDVAILSKIERGERTAPKEQLMKISKVLEIEPDILLGYQIIDNIISELENSHNPQEIIKIIEKELKHIF